VSLDLIALATQVREMGEDIASTKSDVTDRVRWARLLLQKHSNSYHEVAATIRQSRQTRTARAALPMEPLAARHAPPLCPYDYAVAAADGSQAEPDRHGHVIYYLINIGTALIRYGHNAAASFRSIPRLYYRHEDLYVVEEREANATLDDEPREAAVDGEILAMKRSVAEIEDLARLAQNVPSDLPAVLLIDGTLTLFAKLTGEDAWVGKQLIGQYRAALDEIRQMGLPIAGFISRSNATWVIDMLRVGVCQRQVEHCAFCRGRSQGDERGCALSGLRDRVLYDNTLNEPDVPAPLRRGERSALFQVSASLFQDYGPNEPVMFYLNTGHEIAQVQVPMWVAQDEKRLHQVHAVVYDQCQNGNGYPTALTRAHEQAVVTASDRETVDNLILAQLVKLKLTIPISEKARSKQVRGI
jgi:hypothetical protein